MNPLRVAILVAFFGSTLWAFSLYLPVRLGWAPEDASMFVAQTRKELEDERKNAEPIDWHDTKKLEADTRIWKAENALQNEIAEGLILGSASRKEVVIVTIAGIAWVLAGMVKSKV
jgi:hypothetical protein